MATTAQNDIITVMQTPLMSLSSIDASDVNYINGMYDPVQGTPWLQAFMFFSESTQASLGTTGLQRYDGYMQIDICVPVGKGRSALNTITAELMSTYKRGTTLTNANISVTCKRAWEGTPYSGDGWYVTPLNVRWYGYTTI